MELSAAIEMINRMQFLKGDLSGERLPIRPPWALTETRFIAQCSRCGDCVQACADGLIQVGRGGFPQIDFSAGGCDFCRACVEVCKPQALCLDTAANAAPWVLGVSILDSCLSLNGVVCRACGEACEPRAIRFRPEVGGVARPLLNREACTGCGACFAICPVKAVKILPVKPRDQAA